MQYFIKVLLSLNLICFIILLSAEHGTAQSVEASFIFGEEVILEGISGAALQEDALFVLTSAEPYIHKFNLRDSSSYSSWGRKGNGPGEVNNPIDIELADNSIYLLDLRPGACKLIQYNQQGVIISEYPLNRVGIKMCYRFEFGSGFKLLEIGRFAERERHLVLLDDNSNRLDTLTVLLEPASKKVLVPEGPMRSWNFTDPFIPAPYWSLSENGKLYYWSGEEEYISISGLRTNNISKLKTSEKAILISVSDIDFFIDKRFPLNGKPLFGHKNPYRHLRGKIKKELEESNSEFFPLVNSIKIDPLGNIWMLKASKADGQIWSSLSENGSETTYKFTKGKTVMVFGKMYIAMRSKNELNDDIIELYDREKILEQSKMN
ncbi:MAG: hypothetical protein WD059_02025 [Balneolaceae bacterium]